MVLTNGTKKQMSFLCYLVNRNVTEHTRGVGITEDIDTENELILARASIFVSPSDISTWQICPAIDHAYVLAGGEGPTDVVSRL